MNIYMQSFVKGFSSLPLLLAWIVLNAIQGDTFASVRPNIVFIMADDLGLGDINFYQEQFLEKQSLVKTPVMDTLARSGMWFTDAHSSTALCSPTRYCVMSGNLNYRSYAPWGVWGTFRENAISVHEATLGSVAKDAGYRSAFIGKWHLGGDFRSKISGGIYRGEDHKNEGIDVDVSQIVSGGPQSRGFDYSFTLPCGIQGPVYVAYENSVWYPLAEGSQIVYLDEFNTDPKFVSDKGPGMGDSNWDPREMGKLLSRKAVDFIKENAGARPFFLCYWSPIVHKPHCPTDEFDKVKIANTTPSRHMDMIRDLDQQVARIIRVLKELGAYENTLILFTSDNGGLNVDSDTRDSGHDSSGGWRGFKNAPHEGGHRVPFIAVWEGIIEANTIVDEPIINHDVLATMADLLKVNVPRDQAMDSHSLLPLLLGNDSYTSREYLMLQSGSRTEVIFRQDGWKLIMQSDHESSKFDPIALFDLNANPLEKEELNFVDRPEYQSKVSEMRNRYIEIRTSGIRTTPPAKR